jgi:hypothetical protein
MKKNIVIATLMLISNNALLGMLSEWKHKPIIAEQSPAIAEQRSRMRRKVIPSDKIASRPATKEENECDCHGFVLYTLTGYYPASFINDEKSPSNIEKYFYQVETPKEGDLVVYTINENNRRLTHTGIYREMYDKVQSKWGKDVYIFLHDLFIVPDIYGNASGYFRLMNKYKKNKHLMAYMLYEDMKTHVFSILPKLTDADFEASGILPKPAHYDEYKKSKIIPKKNQPIYADPVTTELEFYRNIRDNGLISNLTSPDHR